MSTLTRERDDLRKQLEAKSKVLAEIQTNGFKDEDGKIVVSEKARTEFTKELREAKAMRGRLAELGEFEEITSYLEDPGTESKSIAGGGGKSGLIVPQQRGLSLGERFVQSAEFKARGSNGIMADDFHVDHDLLGPMERKDIYTSAGGTLTRFGFGTVEQEPLVQRPYRTDRVRDLFPAANTSANLIEYMRVLGYLDNENNARPVPERETDDSNFGLKPQTKLKLVPSQAPIRTIAHWEVAHRNTLDDEPMLRSIIDQELLYGLRLVEDDQVLNGNGGGENLLGILRTPGVQNYPGTGTSPVEDGDTYLDAVRRAATRVMLAYYNPTGVVVHPLDWERMETTKDRNGQYLISMNVAVGGEKRVWQMPVVATPAMNQGTALIGAFGLAAKIYDRQSSNIRVAEQHADLFIRNAILILAEQRLGLTVSRPEAFIKVDLANSTAPFAA